MRSHPLFEIATVEVKITRDLRCRTNWCGLLACWHTSMIGGMILRAQHEDAERLWVYVSTYSATSHFGGVTTRITALVDHPSYSALMNLDHPFLLGR
jgi:hypothetical protein